jgi:hypothetical protein
VSETRLREDVTHLAGMTRDSAGPGERASAAWLAGRLRALGAHDVRVEPYRYQGTYAWVHALHVAAGLLGPGALAAAAAISLELDASGRNQWLRRLLPTGEGANVVARAPARGTARTTLVLVAHHDAARTGLVWRRELMEAGAARRLRRRVIDPFLLPPAIALLLAATPARRFSRLPLALALAANVDIALSRTVPGASDNATGVAAVLELVRRFLAEPLEGVDVLAVLPGGEEAGMGGMAAFLREHALDPAATFVLGLDTLGAGKPIVLTADVGVLPHRYREQDVARVENAARVAGLEAPERWRVGGWTDPILAVFAGLPAVSLLSIGPKGIYPNYHRPSDLPENVDWESVDACVELAAATAAQLAAGLSAR